MDSIVAWLTKKFSNPFSLLFFVLGTVLLLLGLTSELQIPLMNILPPADDDARRLCLLLGAICLLASIFVYYIPRPNPYRRDKEMGNYPESFFARKALISKTQRELLDFIESKESVLISDLLTGFKHANGNKSELYYRLEQLRLLGFIEKEKWGNATTMNERDRYHLSNSYQQEIKNTIGTAKSDTTSEGPEIEESKNNPT